MFCLAENAVRAQRVVVGFIIPLDCSERPSFRFPMSCKITLPGMFEGSVVAGVSSFLPT